MMHTIEKIGASSMSDYVSIRDNIILKNHNLSSDTSQEGKTLYQRVFDVSAYGGITDKLLEHKKSGQPGVFALFFNSIEDKSWLKALEKLRQEMHEINKSLFGQEQLLSEANQFIDERLDDTKNSLDHLYHLCLHGHFALETHIETVREMLSSTSYHLCGKKITEDTIV